MPTSPKLTIEDYQKILKYYKIKFDNIKPKTIKQRAEKLLNEKLCKCIKKVNKKTKGKRRGYGIKNGTRKINESRSIALCKSSVLHKKGLTDSGFGCKKKKFINLHIKPTVSNKTRKH